MPPLFMNAAYCPIEFLLPKGCRMEGIAPPVASPAFQASSPIGEEKWMQLCCGAITGQPETQPDDGIGPEPQSHSLYSIVFSLYLIEAFAHLHICYFAAVLLPANSYR